MIFECDHPGSDEAGKLGGNGWQSCPDNPATRANESIGSPQTADTATSRLGAERFNDLFKCAGVISASARLRIFHDAMESAFARGAQWIAILAEYPQCSATVAIYPTEFAALASGVCRCSTRKDKPRRSGVGNFPSYCDHFSRVVKDVREPSRNTSWYRGEPGGFPVGNVGEPLSPTCRTSEFFFLLEIILRELGMNLNQLCHASGPKCLDRGINATR